MAAQQSTTKPEDLEFMKLLGRIQSLPEAKKAELRQHVMGNQEPVIPAAPLPKEKQQPPVKASQEAVQEANQPTDEEQE